jgi:DNA polymerase III delta prime subunit
MNKLKIKSIKNGIKHQVYDLSVNDNHNFFITDNQILTHNCDYLSHNAQAILRGLMETYSAQARFILTCNLPHKIMPALHSRCQGFHIDKTDPTEFTARAAKILIDEEVQFDLDVLDSYVKASYPDLRKCLNLVQANSITGSLKNPGENDRAVSDWKLEVVNQFKAGKIRDARATICNQAAVEDIDEIFRWAYDNLSLWSDSEEGQDEAILIIRKGMVNHSMCADPEINLSATLVELTSIGK